MLVEQQPHELGYGERRMGVVELNGEPFMEIVGPAAAERGAFEKAVEKAMCGDGSGRAANGHERKWFPALAVAQYGTRATANHALDGCGDWFANQVASFVTTRTSREERTES